MQKIIRLAMLLVFIAVASSARAQTAPIPEQSSGALEASHAFSGNKLLSLTVVWHTAANRWLEIFNANAIPSNGSVTPIFCAPISASTDPADGFKSFDWSMHPIQMPPSTSSGSGILAAVSISATGCFALTADSANDAFFGQVTN